MMKSSFCTFAEHCLLFFSALFHYDPLWPSSAPPVTCTVPTRAFSCVYHNMAGTPFPIMLCLHLTHQTVAVPAARAPAQITTRQLIELFFSSQAGGHCKNIPTLEYGFLVQVRLQEDQSSLNKALIHRGVHRVLFCLNLIARSTGQNWGFVFLSLICQCWRWGW